MGEEPHLLEQNAAYSHDLQGGAGPKARRPQFRMRVVFLSRGTLGPVLTLDTPHPLILI